MAWVGLGWLDLAGLIPNKNISKKDLNSGPEIFELVLNASPAHGR
jgi:hypothetical protein